MKKITRENHLDILFSFNDETPRAERMEMASWILENMKDLVCKQTIKWADMKIDVDDPEAVKRFNEKFKKQ